MSPRQPSELFRSASMRQRGIGLTRILAVAAAGAEENGGLERLKTVLEQVAGDGDLVYAGIVDRDGAVVLGWLGAVTTGEGQRSISGKMLTFAVSDIPPASVTVSWIAR